MPSYGDLFGKITIDSVNKTINLYYGDGNDQLRKGAGLFNGSFLPGFNRTSLIAGHSLPYFECLGDVNVGDIIKISTHYGDFEYKITDTKIGKIKINGIKTKTFLRTAKNTDVLAFPIAMKVC